MREVPKGRGMSLEKRKISGGRKAPEEEEDLQKKRKVPPKEVLSPSPPHFCISSDRTQPGGPTPACPLTGERRERMEEGKIHPPEGVKGVFAYLEMLEAQARKRVAKKQRKEQLARLKAKVQELRQRRDELRAKVELQEQGQPEKGGVVSDPAQCSAQAVLEWKIRKVKSTLQVFYLTGISGKLSKHGVCFCISTAYESTYLDFYYLDLLTEPEVRIHRHSIPVFIPLEQIAKKYLQTDIRRFLSVLSDHLNAYVGRRYQADQLQEHFSDRIEGTMQRNSLCNLLVFNYNPSNKSKTFLFNARLLYGDLCCSLPTEVVVSCASDAPAALAETAAAHSDLFRRLALHKAFSSFSSVGERVDGAW